MGNARLYEIMKEKDAIYMKEDFTDEDGIKAAELEGRVCLHERLGGGIRRGQPLKRPWH